MLTKPDYADMLELPDSRVWREDSGIVCVISKKADGRTPEQARESLEKFVRFAGGEKVCMLIDVTNTSEPSREMRAFAAEEFPKIVKAIAMVSGSALGRMLANLFFNLKAQPYPVRMFNDENEARAWLKTFLG